MAHKQAAHSKRSAPRERAEALRRQIEHHNTCYYVLDKPEISDYEFDQLMAELIRLEQAHPELITPDSPTQRVGGEPIKVFPSFRHRVPMLSLDNTYSMEELVEYDQRVRRFLGHRAKGLDYVVEPKIDGVAVALHYEAGRLSVGATRGNGRVGDEITQNLKTIPSIPLRVRHGRYPIEGLNFEVRGEVFLGREAFRRINEARLDAGEDPFANPRNAAAGSLKLQDPCLVAQRRLDCFLYAYHPRPDAPGVATHMEALALLRDLGFKVNPHIVHCAGIQEVMAHCDVWESRRDTLDYEIDGLVVKVNALDLQEHLGATGKGPRWAISYKFPARQATTQLLDIRVQVGRTGALTPVAILEPVPLGGVVVKRATLHNEDEIRRKDIRIGDRVIVERGGEVIPKVVGVVAGVRDGSERLFRMPTRCPVCGGKVIRPEGEAVSRCVNVSCPAQVQRTLEYFAGRNAMDIEHLGSATVRQLLEKGLVRDVADLYRLNVEDLLPLERMAQKSAENLVEAIQGSKTRPLSRLIFALGIRHVGTRTAEILAERFKSVNALKDASQEALEAIPEVGPVVAEGIVDFFREARNRLVIEKLGAAGVRMTEPRAARPKAKPLAGKTFVFTGALSIPRDEAAAQIKALGGRVMGSVSRKTDYVVVGKDPGTKAAKAQGLGVAMLDEKAFQKLLGKGASS